MNRLGLLLISPIIAIGMIYTAIRYICCIAFNPAKALEIAKMVDETANVDINGRMNETISARAARAQQANRPWGCILCGILDWIKKDHCHHALTADIWRN